MLFFPTLVIDVPNILTESCLWPKFCWKFKLSQVSFCLSSLKFLYSWIACLNFIISSGNALLWNLCNASYDILKSCCEPSSFSAFADAVFKCFFRFEWSLSQSYHQTSNPLAQSLKMFLTSLVFFYEMRAKNAAKNAFSIFQFIH